MRLAPEVEWRPSRNRRDSTPPMPNSSLHTLRTSYSTPTAYSTRTAYIPYPALCLHPPPSFDPLHLSHAFYTYCICSTPTDLIEHTLQMTLFFPPVRLRLIFLSCFRAGPAAPRGAHVQAYQSHLYRSRRRHNLCYAHRRALTCTACCTRGLRTGGRTPKERSVRRRLLGDWRWAGELTSVDHECGTRRVGVLIHADNVLFAYGKKKMALPVARVQLLVR